METNTLTLCTGAHMPLLGFGTYKITGKDLIANCLDAALTAGYHLIDTASVYRNESDIGTALPHLLSKHQLSRSDIFITSKLGPKDHGSGKSRDACLRTLRDLGVDYLDLYLIHWPGVQGMKPDDKRISELRRQSWFELEKLYDEGLVKSIGVSNYLCRHIEELLQYCRIKPALLQTELHPHLVPKDLIALCAQNDITVQAYSSLGTSFPVNELLTDAVVAKVANDCNRTVAQVLLRWAVQQNIGVLPKSVHPERIAENARIFDFQLSDDQMATLNSINTDMHYCWDPTSVL